MATTDFQPVVNYDKSVTIASGQQTSGAVDLSGCVLVGLDMPSAFTGTTVTFTVSSSQSGTYKTLYKDGANVSVTVTASRQVVLQPADFAGVRFLKVVSGSAEAAERTITLVTRPV